MSISLSTPGGRLSGAVHGCPPVPVTAPERGGALGTGIRELAGAPCLGPCEGPRPLEIVGLALGPGGPPHLDDEHRAVLTGGRVAGLSPEHDGDLRAGFADLLVDGLTGERHLYHRLLARGLSDAPLVVELLQEVGAADPGARRASRPVSARVSALPEGVAIDELEPDGRDDCVRLLGGRLVALTLVATGTLHVRPRGLVARALSLTGGTALSAARGVAGRRAVSRGR